MWNYILARLGEASTIRGILMFFGGIGLTLQPALADQIIAMTVAGSGILGILLKDS